MGRAGTYYPSTAGCHSRTVVVGVPFRTSWLRGHRLIRLTRRVERVPPVGLVSRTKRWAGCPAFGHFIPAWTQTGCTLAEGYTGLSQTQRRGPCLWCSGTQCNEEDIGVGLYCESYAGLGLLQVGPRYSSAVCNSSCRAQLCAPGMGSWDRAAWTRGGPTWWSNKSVTWRRKELTSVHVFCITRFPWM